MLLRNKEKHLSPHVCGRHFAVGWYSCCSSEVGTTRSLDLAQMEQFSPISEAGLCGSLIFCLFPNFGWSVRLQSCWLIRRLLLLREAADVRKFSLWPTTGFLPEQSMQRLFILARRRLFWRCYYLCVCLGGRKTLTHHYLCDVYRWRGATEARPSYLGCVKVAKQVWLSLDSIY